MDAEFVKECWVVLSLLGCCQLAWFIGMLKIDLDSQKEMKRIYSKEE